MSLTCVYCACTVCRVIPPLLSDFHSGIAVNSLGHSHPGWVSAVSSQAGSLTHVSNLFYSRPQTQLAKQLIELSGGRFDKVFFCNSGTEANEAALKFARKYQMEQYRKKTGAKQSTNGVNAERVHEKMKLIAFQGGFHGRTIGALSLTSKWPYRAPFAPLLADVSMLPFNDEAALSAINAETAAVFVEPVQGEGGVYPSRPSFLASIRSKCNSHDALMIVDEVQCGLSRTGAPFAHQHEAFDYVEPDMMTLAKPLAGGLPIGAVLLKNKVAEAMQRQTHTTHAHTHAINKPGICCVQVALFSFHRTLCSFHLSVCPQPVITVLPSVAVPSCVPPPVSPLPS